MTRVSIELLERMLKDGKTIEEIAEYTKENRKYIYSIIHRFKIPGYKRPSKVKDLTKEKFERLKPIRLAKYDFSKRKGKHAVWECQCDCGTIKEVSAKHLKSGATISCGCYNREPEFKGYKEITDRYWKVVQKGAKSRDLEFNITIEQMWDLFIQQDRRCALTGLELYFVSNYLIDNKDQTASLDRIDSKKHYTIDNVQWVHKDVNWIKNKWDQDRFIEICKLVANHNK